MEISTEISKDARRHTITGPIDVEELTNYLETIYRSPDFDLEKSSLWDLREADTSSVSVSGVRSLIEFVGKHWGKTGKAKSALVVARDFDFGMSRMYQMLLEGKTASRVSVFRDIDEAEKWIGKK